MNIWYLYTHIYKKNTKHLYGLMRHIDIIYETFCYLNFVLRTNKYYTFMKTKTSTKIISLRRYRDERFPSVVVFLCFQFQRLYFIYIFWRLRGSYIKIEILYYVSFSVLLEYANFKSKVFQIESLTQLTGLCDKRQRMNIIINA